VVFVIVDEPGAVRINWA